MNYDLIVIGGGPAGYVGAIRAAQLGKKVACVEKERAGGTCLNWGCIPTKSLLRNAELFHLMRERAAEFGFKFDNLSYDWNKIIKRSRDVSDVNAKGIEFLFKKNKVDYIRGEADIEKPGTIKVRLADGKEQTLTASKILVATGCTPRPMPGFPFNGKTVISSKEAMILPEQPKSMIIIGAGAIGMEFGYFYNAFGTKVTIIEMMPNLLPVEDTEVSQTVEKAYKKMGINVFTNTKVVKAETTDKGVRITVEGPKNETLEADVALVAIGVQPLLPTGNLKFELTERGYIKTNDNYETSIPGIYAAGDIIGPPWLAHVASYEAIQAVEGMFKGIKPKKVTVFPGCTYCQPQVASFGLTEQQARDEGYDIKVAKFPFTANGKAHGMGAPGGFVKLIADAKYGELLGGHMIGHDVSELLPELTLAQKWDLTANELARNVHTHPTLSEAMQECFHGLVGHMINF